MCADYKDEVQTKLNLKFEDKSKDLPEFIKDYFEFMKSADTKINTFGVVNKFLVWLMDNNVITTKICDIKQTDLLKVNDVHIVKYLNSLKSKGMAHTSLNTKMNQLSGFWNYLTEKKYVELNIINNRVRDLYTLEERTGADKVPEESDVEELLSNIYNIPNESVAIKYTAIVKLLIGSGIRIRELVGLDVEDVHFDDVIPYITVMSKGRQNSMRKVKISKTAIDAVNDYIKIRNLDVNKCDLKPLFLSVRNSRLSESTVKKELKEHSGGKIHPHSLRDYTATTMHNNGIDIVLISDQLGHKSIDTTKRRYIKIDETAQMNALNTIH